MEPREPRMSPEERLARYRREQAVGQPVVEKWPRTYEQEIVPTVEEQAELDQLPVTERLTRYRAMRRERHQDG
jgi:hypothetical protein